MKRYIFLILILLIICGCSQTQENIQEPKEEEPDKNYNSVPYDQLPEEEKAKFEENKETS